MYPVDHKDAKCQNRENCTGPGCRLNTGKTDRKRSGTGLPLKGHYDIPKLRLDIAVAHAD